MKQILACLAGLLCTLQTSQAEGPVVGQPAPSLSIARVLQAPTNAQASWTAFKGKSVVLEFWATWCGPCVGAIPHLNALADTYSAKGVRFLSVTNEPASTVEPFLKKRPMKSWIGLDQGNATFNRYGVTAIPVTVLVDKNGVVAAITSPDQVNEKMLDDLIAGRPIQSKEPVVQVPNLTEKPIFEFRVTPGDPKATSSTVSSNPTGFSLVNGRPAMILMDLYGLPAARAIGLDLLPTKPVNIVASSGNAKLDETLPIFRKSFEAAFGVKIKREVREVDAWVLTAEGFKLPTSGSPYGWGYSGNQLSLLGAPMLSLVTFLENYVKGPVVDQTGLTTRHDFILKISGESPEAIAGDLKSQFGIEMKKAKQQMEVLVIEKA